MHFDRLEVLLGLVQINQQLADALEAVDGNVQHQTQRLRRANPAVLRASMGLSLNSKPVTANCRQMPLEPALLVQPLLAYDRAAPELK